MFVKTTMKAAVVGTEVKHIARNSETVMEDKGEGKKTEEEVIKMLEAICWPAEVVDEKDGMATDVLEKMEENVVEMVESLEDEKGRDGGKSQASVVEIENRYERIF